MLAGWVINLAVAEWILRRRASRPAPASAAFVGAGASVAAALEREGEALLAFAAPDAETRDVRLTAARLKEKSGRRPTGW